MRVADWRDYRTIALNFSAALDGLFKLNGIGALEESVEQKYDHSVVAPYERISSPIPSPAKVHTRCAEKSFGLC